MIITARKRSLRRLCFYTCLSFCPRGGGIPACLAGIQGELKGSGQRGVSRPTPGGISRPTPNGFSRPTWGVSQHALRQTPLLMRAVCILLECILVSNCFHYLKIICMIFLHNQFCFARCLKDRIS